MPLVVISSMPMAEVSITSRGAKRIRNGHLWVYRSDLVNPEGVEGGAIVRVVDQAHNFVGQAFYSDASEIALRFLTTREETIDREWWRMRLRACAERRSWTAAITNAWARFQATRSRLRSETRNCRWRREDKIFSTLRAPMPGIRSKASFSA